jgi:hypothetical protein
MPDASMTKRAKKRALYPLKITPRDIDPSVWRRVHIWEDTKLPQWHRSALLSRYHFAVVVLLSECSPDRLSLSLSAQVPLVWNRSSTQNSVIALSEDVR